MGCLVELLTDGIADSEIINAVLETLMTLLSNRPTDKTKADLGCQFTEIFIKNQNNVSLLLDLLRNPDFYVRFHTLELLSIITSNKLQQIQDLILGCPNGISNLVESLNDSREIIRNGITPIICIRNNSFVN